MYTAPIKYNNEVSERSNTEDANNREPTTTRFLLKSSQVFVRVRVLSITGVTLTINVCKGKTLSRGTNAVLQNLVYVTFIGEGSQLTLHWDPSSRTLRRNVRCDVKTSRNPHLQ